jgi:hypothetical protein
MKQSQELIIESGVQLFHVLVNVRNSEPKIL